MFGDKMMDKTKELMDVTRQLIDHLEQLKATFFEGKSLVGDRDDFEIVKEATTPIFILIESWEEMAADLAKQRKINLHPQQIQSTTENMELLLMHSYYRDVRERKYMETNKSCLYIFNQLLGEITDE